MDDFVGTLSPREQEELRQLLGARVRQKDKIAGDQSAKLKEPIAFSNPKYPEERFYVGGKLKQFGDGTFIAKTEDEAATVRRMGAHIFEGQDIPEGRLCPNCQRRFYNNAAYIWHMQYQHVVS